MSWILGIDTAGDSGMVLLMQHGQPVAVRYNAVAQQHASFVQPAIAQVCAEAGIELAQVSAVAVNNGPGSYTGLRVGLASAKGICFALQKPLITLWATQLLAAAMRSAVEPADGALFCAMIDARRMEVFTQTFDSQLQPVDECRAVVLDTNFQAAALQRGPIYFGGSGTAKWRMLCQHAHAHWPPYEGQAAAFAQLATSALTKGILADLAYSEPFYAKGFYTFQSSK
jgi:tRNA threonylcarbamoyladenosine biosynthesis protein TsaB